MTKILMGIDIETAGPILGLHPLLAIGFTVWEFISPDNYHQLDEIEVHFHGDINSYDETTLNFWYRNPDSWDHIKSNCVPENIGANLLIEFIKKWQKEAYKNQYSFCIITDNCWFDDTWISNLLCKYGGNPLRHNYYTGYTDLSKVIDINQLILGVRMCGIQYETPKFEAAHTPISDTKNIIKKYICFIDYSKKIKKNLKKLKVSWCLL
jgi:hypothetical protein